ncbi:Rap1a/Tai family immunity protein [Mesorhizobium marinum]|uniref:Rap1a/Tai family immunity protein n=1 Tax=Mesorhizobium marinum TaxID=3228790 RepID=A0ABV3R1B0_9HYPH
MRTIAAALLFVLGFTVSAAAQYSDTWYDGNEIHEGCQTNPFGLTLGFAVGAAESAARKGDACIPLGAKASQVRDVVCRYLEANPQSRQEPAFNLAYKAIISAWPCT